MHADKAGASEAEYDALHVEACLSEVDQQAQVQTGGIEIIQALCAVNIIESSDRLQLKHRTLDQQGRPCAQFMRESILIDLFKKSRSERVKNGEYARPVERDFICVHLRASAVSYSSFRLSQPKLANSLTHPPSRRLRRRA
jgi:hypothetical protein